MEERLKNLESSSPESDEFIESCNELSKDVSSGKIKMLDIVTALGTLLVNNLAEKRAHGTYILSSLIQTLPVDYLTFEELHFLSQFYADRTKDNHQVIPPLLKGVLALSRMKNIDEDSTSILLTAFFNNIPCQQQQVKDRLIIFNILKEFVQKFPNGIEQMGLEFVMGLISTIDGERDPRNLKFLFNWLPNVLKDLKLSHLAEEMFEVISCYFPIDFRAPPTDSPDAVSREELSISLKDCLCSVPEFGEWCIPLILEKLDSNLLIAKTDSLQLLIQGSKVFDSIILESHSIELLKVLRKEAIETHDNDLQTIALDAVTSIFKVYENCPATLETLLTLIDSLINQLVINDKILDDVSRFLGAICRGSTTACNFITMRTLPLLLGALVSETKEVEILRALVEISDAQAKICHVIDENVLEMFFRATVHKKSSVRVVAFVGIKKLERYFNDLQRARLYTLLASHICEPDEKMVRVSILDCLESSYESNGSVLLERVFNKRAHQFRDVRLSLYLEAGCRLIMMDENAGVYLLPELVEQFLNVDKERSMTGLNQLKLLLDNKNDKNIYNILHNQLDLVARTINWIIETNVCNDYIMLQQAAMVCSVLIGRLSTTEQALLIQKWLPKILELCEWNERPPGPYIVVLEALMIRLRIEVLMELPNRCELLMKLLVGWRDVDQEYRVHIIRLAASIINKYVNDKELSDLFIKLETILNENRIQSNLTRVWISKALLLKGSVLTSHWIKELIDLLNLNPSEIVGSFKLIMDDDCICFNKYSHCNIKLLYKQRFFYEVLSKLHPEIPEHLIAIGNLLGCGTLPLLRLYSKEIQRPLLLCLQQCKDSTALRGGLSALLLLLQDKHISLQQHSEALLKPLLHLSSESPFMMVRVDALLCIHQISDAFPLHDLLPHKSQVLSKLIPCLDDRKRLVRHHAVNARTAWFIIDAPT